MPAIATEPVAAAPFTEAELARLRRDTPAWGAGAHLAHFAHGSASLPPEPVYAQWQAWLEAERALGTHRAAERHADALHAVRASVARLVNAQPHQVALLGSASQAWAAAMSAAHAPHVITTHDEYGANALHLLNAAQQRRLGFSVIGTRPGATPLTQRLDHALRHAPAGRRPVVSLAAVPTAWGAATPMDGVARCVHAHGGLLFLDASHAVGQGPVDMQALGCDVLVFPARKWLRGPRGAGVLCLSQRALEALGTPEAIDVAGAQWLEAERLQPWSDARRFERHEFHPGLRLALGAACDYALAVDPARIARQNALIRQRLVHALQERFGWQPLEAGQPDRSALLTYRLPEAFGDGAAFVRRLADAGVHASFIGPQHARWALEAAGLPGVLRFTPHYLTDDDEIARLVQAIETTNSRVHR
ncbi:aminotransferase class V-fold PLP-dependent enzyme [Variovorax sp. Varisp41]|uniref:aminotransferase class V-fold PLP-dependent enzyme n=1 Tax=Variovorax sp. Varisp41 TaxID=3243033 RepID=UPI0039B4A831